MWIRRQELTRLSSRTAELEKQVKALWATLIAVDKRFSASLDWKDNGDLTAVFGDSATRQLTIVEEPQHQHAGTEASNTDVNDPVSERGTGRWLLETPP